MARESVQHKLDRVRAPRVQITYDLEAAGATEARELAFVIGVIGNYSGTAERPRFADRIFHTISFDNFDQVLAELQPRVCFKIPSSLTGDEMTVDITFRAFADFDPERIIEQLPLLHSLRQSDSPEAIQTLGRHLDRVLHAPQFQAIEAAWRSLWFLLVNTETSASLQIRLLDVQKSEILRDFQRAVEFDQSQLFKKLYEGPYGRFGDDPFGLLLGNFEFGLSTEDMELLEGLGRIAAACHAPFIAGASPSMFGLENLTYLSTMRDPGHTFSSPEFARWWAFRASEDARYVGLVLPRCLARGTYGTWPRLPEELQYEEDVRGGQDLLWCTAAFPFGVCVANAFTRYGWCGALRGMESGGLVEGLPTWRARDEGGNETRLTLETSITDRREKELSDLGFLSLLQVKNTDYAVFFSTPSCARAKLFEKDEANANSRLSCQLPYVLTASRFVHYLKVMARDNVGAFHSRGEWEDYFNRWISNYVILDDNASPALKAKYPLREARIEIAEDPVKPGSYRAVAFLRPAFQLEELSVSLRVVTNIP